MTINGWDVSNAGAKQWNVTPGFHETKNDSEWVRGSPIPSFCKKELDFKSIKVVLLVKAENRQALLNRCSEILTHLTEPAELVLDGFDHAFYGVMTKYSHEEKSMKHWHTLTLEFDGYEYSKEATTQTFSGVTNFTVTNPGNIVTPVVLEITPQIGAASIEISGICRDSNTEEDLPVTIRELTTGNKVILDGMTGLFTQSGELKTKDIDIWGLPALLPGENQITVNNSRMDISVIFHPRFM